MSRIIRECVSMGIVVYSAEIRSIARVVAAVLFTSTGILHFVRSATFARIVPPMFPHPLLLVRISGVCEIAGAVGLLVPRLRKPAAWGLIALLVAVFPANIYMALKPEHFSDLKIPSWGLWLRLPLQAGLVAWVWWVGQKPERAISSERF